MNLPLSEVRTLKTSSSGIWPLRVLSLRTTLSAAMNPGRRVRKAVAAVVVKALDGMR